MSSEKQLIVVAGATGTQGGSVVRFLLQDGGFRIRAITRKVDSPKAKELAEKGVEVVQADFDDLDSLKRAFKGAYGVFGVTNFWELMNGAKETEQGKKLVDAAKAEGVRHFVWSTLEHTSNPPIPHANSKALVDDYLKTSGVPRTSLYTVFYYENFQYLFPLSKAADGTVEGNWPILKSDGPIAAYAAADTGAWVTAAFKSPSEWLGKDMNIISETITPRKVVDTLNKFASVPIKLHEVSAEAFDSLKDVPGYVELWNNMTFFYSSNGNPGRDFEMTKQVYPRLQTFEMWARERVQQLLPQ